TQVHVRFFDADEAFDRGAVEHDPAVERLLELAVGDLDVLDRPEDIGELKAHELDLLVFHRLENLRLAFAVLCTLRRWQAGRTARTPRTTGLCHVRDLNSPSR